MEILKTHTTSAGNQLEFGTSELAKNSIIVFDKSCCMERIYTIGANQVLSFEDYEKEVPTLIVSFEQVINAWVNEEIHF